MASSISPSAYNLRSYMLAGISALLAFFFYARVNRRFALMEEGLKTATKIRYELEWDELEEIAWHHEAYHSNHEGIRDLLLAIEYAHEAHALKNNMTKETQEIEALKEDAAEEKEKMDAEQKEASMWALRAFGDGRASIGSEMTGVQLARQAQEENERGNQALRHANLTLVEGTQKLREAEATLQLAEEAKNRTKLDKGLCRWIPVACSLVRGRPSHDGNTTYVARPTDVAIQANKDIQNALEEIHDAKEEKNLALELLVNASSHANLSTEILQDAAMFRKQAGSDREELNKFRVEEMEDEREYNSDEKMIKTERSNLELQRLRLYNCTNSSKSYLNQAIQENLEFHRSVEKFKTSREKALEREILLDKETEEAKRHVAKAGWSALVACVAGACLLTIVLGHIFATFRYQRPLLWVVRGQPETTHDLLYLVNHISIFLLATGYVGELLNDFDRESKVHRAAVTLVFSLVSGTIQVLLLHFIPHIFRMVQVSTLRQNALRMILHEDVIKKGSIVSLVFAIEMLLCWVNFGMSAFSGAHKCNSWATWIIVASLAGSYNFYVIKGDFYDRQTDTTRYLDVFDNISSTARSALAQTHGSAQMSNPQEETRSLLADLSTSDSKLLSTRDLASTDIRIQKCFPNSIMKSESASKSSSSSMRSVPLGDETSSGYGAFSDLNQVRLSILPEIRGSFMTSWTSELEKVQLLFEILMASWAIWIVRRDVSLIVKLYPLAKDVVFGRCPLWILNIFVLILLVIFVSSRSVKSSTNSTVYSYRGA